MTKLLSQTLFTDMKENKPMSSMFKVFNEKPSDSRMKQKIPADKRICAHELFSMFTADIIREKTVFVR